MTERDVPTSRHRHGYALVIERSPAGGYGVYAPDLPGCVATARTRSVAIRRMREAIHDHITGLRSDGLPVPPALTEIGYA